MTTKIEFKVGATADGAPIAAFSNEVKKLGDTAKTATGSFSSLGGVIKGFLLYKATGYLKEFGQSIFEMADQLEAAAIATGVSAEELQKLKIIAEQNNITFESLQGGLKKLAKGFFDAQTGSKEFQNVFKTLGVDLNETQLGKILEQTAKGFARLKDEQGKQALASKVFGRALSSDAIPFLNELAKGMGDIKAIMSNDMVDRINDVADKFKLLRANAQGVGANIISDLLPSISKLFDYFAMASQSDFVDAIKTTLQVLIDFGIELIDFFDDLALQITNSIDEIGFSIKKIATISTFGDTKQLEKEQGYILQIIEKRNNDYLKRQQELFKASSLRFDGDMKTFWATRAKETKPEEKAKGGSSVVDRKLFNQQEKNAQDEAKKYAEERIQKINLETQALTALASVQRENTELKQLEFHGIKRGTDDYKKYSEAIIEALRAQEEMRNSAETGARQFFRDYAEHATNAAEITKLAFTSVFKNLEDTLVDFITKGKASFADFARAIIADITRIYVRAAITGPLAQALAGAFGGATSAVTAQGAGAAFQNTNAATINVPTGYAKGGIVDRPTVAMFGEAGAEAFVPLPDGKRIPVQMHNKTQGDTNVSVAVNMQTGAVETSGDNSKYNRFGEAISQAVQAEIIKQKRSGGLLS